MVSNVMLSFPVGDAIGTMSIPRNQTFKSTTFIFLLFLRFTIILFSKKKKAHRPKSQIDRINPFFHNIEKWSCIL